MTGKLTCRPVLPEDKPGLLTLAMSDGHAPLIPTHVWERDGKVLGYTSIGAVTVLCGWAHSAEVTDAEALQLLQFSQDEAARQGAQVLMLPTTPDCRFTPWVAADRKWTALTPAMTIYMRKI
jgi:hypothetical protein